MLLAFDVFILHFFAIEALFLPIELEVDVTSDGCDAQVLISQFHNFTLDVLVFDVVELWVQLEVLCDNLIG